MPPLPPGPRSTAGPGQGSGGAVLVNKGSTTTETLSVAAIYRALIGLGTIISFLDYLSMSVRVPVQVERRVAPAHCPSWSPHLPPVHYPGAFCITAIYTRNACPPTGTWRAAQPSSTAAGSARGRSDRLCVRVDLGFT